MINKFRLILFIILISVLANGCSWNNSAIISDYAAFNGELYIGTSIGDLHIYNTISNKFERVSNIKGQKISRLLVTNNKFLIIETTEFIKDRTNNKISLNTRERIYLLSPNGGVVPFNERLTPGFKQYDSSLKSSDDKYIYGYRNKPAGGKWETEKTFRIDLNSKETIDNHFDFSSDYIVEDIFEDENYFWYLCLYNVEASGWATNRGNPVVVRKNKKTNEIIQIHLKDSVLEGRIFIFGDNQNIWVSGRTSRKNFNSLLFKISKSELTYESEHLTDRIYHADENFLWSTISGKKFTLYGKNDLKKTVVDVGIAPHDSYNNYPSLAIGNYVYGATFQHTKRGMFGSGYAPFIIKVSAIDHNYEAIPLKTTVGEGLGNFGDSIIDNIKALVLLFMSMLGGGM